MQADVVVLRTDRPNIFPINDPIGAVVWGMDTSNVDWVFVGGRVLMRDGVLEADVAACARPGARPASAWPPPPARRRRGTGGAGMSAATTAPREPSSALTSFVVASRYLPVYVAIALLVVVASIWAPATLSGPGSARDRAVRDVPRHHGPRPDARDHDRRDRPQRPGDVHALPRWSRSGVGQASDEQICDRDRRRDPAGRAGRPGERDPHRRPRAQRADRHPRRRPDRDRRSRPATTRARRRSRRPVPAGRCPTWTSTRFFGVTPDVLGRGRATLVLIVVFRFTTPGAGSRRSAPTRRPRGSPACG